MSIDVTKKVQKYEIDILQQIDKICKKHNLQYWGIGGTALGAVRHEGFIPWDDDIDIGMTRDDYEKFLSYVQTELPKGYHVQNFFTEPKAPFYFTKIRKDNTKFVEYYLREYKMHQGIFVDIFPFDNIPDNQIVANIHFRISRFLYQLYLCKSLKTICSSRFEQQGEYKKKYKNYVRLVLHYLLLPVPKSLLFFLMDRSVRFFNKKETMKMGHIVRRRLAVTREVLYPITYLKFDSIEMPVPRDYDQYLKNQFGDYKKIPPREKQFGHLPYLIEFENEGEKEC